MDEDKLIASLALVPHPSDLPVLPMPKRLLPDLGSRRRERTDKKSYRRLRANISDVNPNDKASKQIQRGSGILRRPLVQKNVRSRSVRYSTKPGSDSPFGPEHRRRPGAERRVRLLRF